MFFFYLKTTTGTTKDTFLICTTQIQMSSQIYIYMLTERKLYHPNDSIAKNGQNPETNPGDLRRLAVTQTPVKNHQQMLEWKTLKGVTIIIIRLWNGDTNCNWRTWHGSQKLGKWAGWVGNWRTSRAYHNYRISKIVQNTEKSPGDLRRLAVTQTPVKDHQLTLMWKTRKKNKNKFLKVNKRSMTQIR